MKKIKPVTFLNHPNHLVFDVLSPKADRDTVTVRAYEQLVTSHGVPPERARQLLNLTKH